MTELHISPVAGRAQVNSTHPDTIGEPDVGTGSPIFRVPEFVRHGSKARPPGARDCARSVMAKRSTIGFMLAIALDRCDSVTGNFNTWPSCIHANPAWDKLEPGEEATVRGKIYFFPGTLEDVTERYVRDFEAAQ